MCLLYALRLTAIGVAFVCGLVNGHGWGPVISALCVLVGREVFVTWLGDFNAPKEGQPGYWSNAAFAWMLLAIEAAAYGAVLVWAS